MPTDMTDALRQLPALAIRAQAIADRYLEARADRNTAAADLVTSVIGLVIPYLPAITGYREEVKLRGIDVFPGALILAEDGGLWERATDGWRPAGPEAVRSVEVQDFVLALVDLFDRVCRGKAQKRTEEERALTDRLRAVTTLLGPGSGKGVLQVQGAANGSCGGDELLSGSEVARRLGVDPATVVRAMQRGDLRAETYIDGKTPLYTARAMQEWQQRKELDKLPAKGVS